MQQIYVFLIGLLVLASGILIGNLLSRATKEELKAGKKWFNLIIVLSLAGAIVFLFLGNDAILFAFLFIAIVTSRSLKK